MAEHFIAFAVAVTIRVAAVVIRQYTVLTTHSRPVLHPPPTSSPYMSHGRSVTAQC
jgi:hypothetical protein